MEQEVSLKAIYIEWYDPHSVDPWTDIEHISDEPALIKSFGFLIKETKRAIIISLNYDPAESAASCTMIIPKSVIRLRYEGKMSMREVK